MLKIAKIESTLRGESPKSGIPTVVLELDEAGKVTDLFELADILHQGVGEVITITGKPFRQLKDLCELITKIGNKNVIIETSGRMTDLDLDRTILIPLVDKTTLVIKPNKEHLNHDNYRWMRNYRFSNGYYKFEWQGSERDTQLHINTFFDITNIDMFKAAKYSRIIVMPSDVNGSFNKIECRDVWNYCLTNELRYSGREHRRLFE